MSKKAARKAAFLHIKAGDAKLVLWDIIKIIMKGNKGFTLIELLVVVGIIGLMATIVMAALSDSRWKSNDTKVRAQLNRVRTAGALHFTNFGTYGVTTAVCTNGMFVETTSGMDKYDLDVPGSTWPSGTQIVCGSNGSAYAVKATLNNDSVAAYWCVDNTGTSRMTVGAIGGSAIVCP